MHASGFVSRLLRDCCPACEGVDLRRTHRRTVLDWVYSPFTIRPYRCHDCNGRFHAMPSLRGLGSTSRPVRALSRSARPPHHRVSIPPSLREKLMKRGMLGLVILAGALWFFYTISRQPG